MRKSNRKLLTAVLFLSSLTLIVIESGFLPRYTSVASQPAGRVEIIRDKWGIPHVFASTEEEAFYGAGYATAEDRMFQMEYGRRVVEGRLAEILGRRALESDRLMRTLGLYRHTQLLEGSLDSETRRFLRAYARGVNKYLEDHKDSLLYLFDRYRIEPDSWTVADSIAIWMRISMFFGGNAWRGKVATLRNFERVVEEVGEEEAIRRMTRRTVDESAAIVPCEEFPLCETLSYLFERRETNYEGREKASHNWTVGKSRMITRNSVLHSDPQIGVTSPPLWYEFRLSGGRFDTRGIGVAGCPGILVGWNRHVAWGATALGSDNSDLYKLVINPENPNQYLFDGVYRDMEVRQETILVRGEQPVAITVRTTHVGPVVTDYVTGEVREGEEFALRHLILEDRDRNTVQGLIKMMRAADWDSFREGLQDYRAPAVHMIYSDSNGNVGYYTAAAIPIRPGASPLGARIPHDGSSSEYDWKGTIPFEVMPHMFNPRSGAISTANNLPVGLWYPYDLAIGTGGGGDSIRSWRLRELFSKREIFSPREILAMHNDAINPAIREIVRLGYHLTNRLGVKLSPDATNALNVLRSWSGSSVTSDPVYALVHHVNTTFRQQTARGLTEIYGGGESGLAYFLKTKMAELDKDPDLPLKDDEKRFIESALADGWRQTVARFGDDPGKWQSRFNSTHQIVYQNTLEGFGSLDPKQDYVSPSLECVMTSTIWSQLGNSYSQFVNFADLDNSKSLLPPGISENPSSPHFGDQVGLWVKGELHPAPLSKSMIER